ncbi:alpha/beta hydrolase [uncultured Ramlibacter sp.]|uniref:alpha/beta hydrolase n=1 Tax=uncultured Ramlibacter sp. TaxID=260755 RepID=UPI0026137DAB|nr:alpha/beta hydrolase [uncultured Ramlibacter sp.]
MLTSLPTSRPGASPLALPGHAPMATRLYGSKPAAGAAPLVLHLHGGAFVDGDLASGECLAQMLAGAGAVVLSLAYPLAPAHPFPQAVEAAYAAMEWLYKQRNKLAGNGAALYVAGDEAGGNLAAAIALMARDRGHPPLAGQILVAPMLDPCTGTASLREAVGQDTCCKWTDGWKQYLRSPRDAEHPYAVPARAQRLAGLAPALVLAGEDDPMRDEAMAYAQRLHNAGISVATAMIPASGWPESLGDASQASFCVQTVQGHLRAFLHAPTPPPAADTP